MQEDGLRSGRIFGVVLAAGRSSRLGFPKALALLDGRTFVSRSVEALALGGCARVVVVVGPPHAERIATATPGVGCAHNPEPERGMLSSLQVGLASLVERYGAADAVLFSLVDHPRVRPETVAALIASFAKSGAPAVRPVHAGRGGHPVLLSPEVVRAVLASPATASIRDVLASSGGVRDLVVDDPGVVDDVDGAGDLAAIGASKGPGRAGRGTG